MPALPAPSAPSRRSVTSARLEGQPIFLARVAFRHRAADTAMAVSAGGGVGSAAAAAEGEDMRGGASGAAPLVASWRPKEVSELISRWTDLLPGSLGANEEQASARSLCRPLRLLLDLSPCLLKGSALCGEEALAQGHRGGWEGIWGRYGL
jgi:hypothetical protein